MKRQARMVRLSARGADAGVEINVTPLVDVVLVLLILFMIVTPLLERQLDLRLPSALPADLQMQQAQVVVEIDARGQMRLDGQPLAGPAYRPALVRALAARPPGAKVVFFHPDDRLPYPTLIAAMEAARQAGAETLGLVPGP